MHNKSQVSKSCNYKTENKKTTTNGAPKWMLHCTANLLK